MFQSKKPKPPSKPRHPAQQALIDLLVRIGARIKEQRRKPKPPSN